MISRTTEIQQRLRELHEETLVLQDELFLIWVSNGVVIDVNAETPDEDNDKMIFA